jgi:peptide chain release factor subunit 1
LSRVRKRTRRALARTINWEDLRELAAFEADKGFAVSLYLDLDPSVTPTPAEAAMRLHSLLDEAGRLGAAHEGLTHDQKVGLRGDLQRIREYYEREFTRDGARSFAIFVDGLDDLWQFIPLLDLVEDEARVARTLYLAPLVPLVGRGEGALVAVVGRERGEIFQLRAGRLIEVADRTEDQPGKHDQGGWSQARYQRHIEHLVGDHLRRVAEDLDRLVHAAQRPRVAVVSSEETRAEFDVLLSNEVHGAIVGWVQAEAHAKPPELLPLVAPILERKLADEETAVLERWREEAGRDGRAAAGWEQTLEAVSDARVELLLFQDGAVHMAATCPRCGRLAVTEGPCPLDGTSMERSEDGLDLAVHQTLRHGGKAWAVRHHQDLEPVEGIGALLRF